MIKDLIKEYVTIAIEKSIRETVFFLRNEIDEDIFSERIKSIRNATIDNVMTSFPKEGVINGKSTREE